jgi:signal transduction histidine kinase/HAMP domain-containing protein
MIMITVIFVLVLSVITVMNILSVEKSINKSKKTIMNSLVAKGKTLVKNNSMAMTGMAADNSFTAIQDLVSSTVKDDDDMVYGIYTNESNVPWVFATSENVSGVVNNPEPLTDSISIWASGLKDVTYRSYMKNKTEVIEFAAPVISEGEILGFIRYGVSTKKMYQSINEALADGATTRNQSIAILILLCLASLASGYFVIRKVARKITNPIASLVNSTKVIAEGNYNIEVKSDSSDEIGNLSNHFESMRSTIKRYTDHLQEIIDEKMQQVNDILNNIDQGLFTINLDGTVNKEYSSRANEILKVTDIASSNINELLRLDVKQNTDFNSWLDLVKKKYSSQRWNKLTKLAPVQELELLEQDSDDQQFVSISYQKIYDKQGELSKIMVLAMDETEKRMKDLQMASERAMHENEVKSILGIANTPAEEIAEFNEDTSSRMRELNTTVQTLLSGVVLQRELHPDGPEYTIAKDQIDSIFRDIHTIKGNAGSYGFELLSAYAHKAEDVLEELRDPIKTRRAESLRNMAGYLGKMDLAIEDIHKKIQLVFGKEEEITVRVPEHRISKIQDICTLVHNQKPEKETALLVDECMMLTWKPLKTLTRKYLKIIQKTTRKLNKNIDFFVSDEMELYAPDELVDIDEALIHLTRNAVDHGIEDPEVREELNKGIGRIKLEYRKTENARTLIISDDGRGVDTDALIEKSIQKGLISAESVPTMNEKDKLMLMCGGGISTAEKITDISGRGIGMNIVIEKIKAMGGTIEIESKFGKGTTFTLVLPPSKTNN